MPALRPLAVAALVAVSACQACHQQPAPPSGPEALRLKVVARHPHDPDAFTQGLLWYRGKVYESTGLMGQSGVRRVDLATGQVEARGRLPDDVFGEGLALAGLHLIQLSWQNEIATLWDLQTLAPVKTFSYKGEGWGLCYDGKRLIMSDGTDRLTFRDPATFAATGEVHVTKDGFALSRLNELECVDGAVYANVWQTEFIARIDPKSGHVTGWIDATNLLNGSERMGTDVLNGIAWIPEREHFLVTGKRWPWLFEVELEAVQP